LKHQERSNLGLRSHLSILEPPGARRIFSCPGLTFFIL
jgi:hypothetical protein